MTPEETAPKKLLPLSRITLDHAIQCRVELDEERVVEYTEVVTEHGNMDPIVVYTEGDPENLTKADEIFLADGWHRIEAYRRAEKEKIPAFIRKGNRSDALYHAIYSMCRHGAPATNADKRKAAAMMVEDPVHGQLDDKKIAKLLGVSASLVNNVRSGRPLPKKKKDKTVVVEPHMRAAPEPQQGPPVVPGSTKAEILGKIRKWVSEDVIAEADVIELFANKDGEYKFVRRAGDVARLRVIGPSRHEQVNVEVVIKEFGLDLISVKFEGPGKLTVKE